MLQVQDPARMKAILCDVDQHERETLLEDRAKAVEDAADQTVNKEPCPKLFWRCISGNFQYRLKVLTLVLKNIMVKSTFISSYKHFG